MVGVVCRLAAETRRRSQILTGILAGHSPRDEAEGEDNGKDACYHECGTGPVILLVELRHDGQSILDK